MNRTNEESLDLFADLLEPAAEILGDKDLEKAYRQSPVKAVKTAIKNHKSAVIEILALIEGVDPAEYKVNILTLPVKLLNLLNRPELNELFTLQGQMNDGANSGSATENTGDGVN